MGVRLQAPEGGVYEIPDDQIAGAVARGWKPLGASEGATFETTPKADTSVSGAAAAGLSSLASGATVGLSDAALRAFGSKADVEQDAKLRRDHSTVSTVAGVAGAVLPALASGGESLLGSLPAGAAARIGGGVAERLGGGIGARVLGGAAEGTVFGAGQGVSELALSNDPLTMEHAASVLSSNMLFGGITGGVATGIGAGVERGLLKAKGALEGAAERSATIANVPEDLAQLDAKGLREARSVEVEKLHGEQVARRGEVVDDLTSYREAVKDANPWRVIDEGENAANLNKADRALRNALDDPKGLAESPQSALKPLRKQEQAIQRALDDQAAITERFAKVNQKLATDLEEELSTLPAKAETVEFSGKLARRYGTFSDVKVGRGTVAVPRDEAAQFLEALKGGQVAGEGEEAFGKLQGLLESNRALQTKITSNLVPKAELASERLSAIDAARDALSAPAAKKTLAQEMLGGTIFHQASSIAGGLVGGIPLVGGLLAPLAGGAAAKLASGVVFAKLGKAAGEVAKRSADAIGTFLEVGKKLAPAAPIAATKVLSAVAYGPPEPKRRGAAVSGSPSSLPALFKKRTDEIKAQTMYDGTGGVVMRPDARDTMAKRLAAVRHVSPEAADNIETLAARRLEFLASKIPRRPDVGGIPIGPDHWQPSDMEMRTFARFVDASENPHGVEQRLAHGTVSPEDAEAYHSIYPERAAALQQEVLSKLPTLQKTLPYARRLALSVFLGVPVDPAMHPQVLAVLQRSFAAEPGTASGTMAPKPEPQFGSVSREQPTPGEKRAQGAQ